MLFLRGLGIGFKVLFKIAAGHVSLAMLFSITVRKAADDYEEHKSFNNFALIPYTPIAV